jgi:hypothetical protein
MILINQILKFKKKKNTDHQIPTGRLLEGSQFKI